LDKVAAATGREPTRALLADWLAQRSGGPVADAAAASLAPPQRSDSWADLDPWKRMYTQPFVEPPPEIASRLVPVTVFVMVDGAALAAGDSSTIAVRQQTADIHRALLRAGSNLTPAKMLPDEPVEVWLLANPDARAEAPVAILDPAPIAGAAIGVTVARATESGAWSVRACALTDEQVGVAGTPTSGDVC